MPEDDGDKADDIEVTPEMIEAGKLALSEYDSRYVSLENGATRVFEAMWEARRPKSEE